MKIGQFVRRAIPVVFNYCEEIDQEEFMRLQDRRYSKETFDINFPFCRDLASISEAEQVRYWTREYFVQGVLVRVSSQWFNPPTSKSLPLFQRYLSQRGLSVDLNRETAANDVPMSEGVTRYARGRYKGNAIGNAQNSLVRNILSRLGDEHFNELQWLAVVDAFGCACAYCGAEGELLMDHAVAINKQSLGEHRLGNLVPSCRACNSRKSGRDFREFLAHDPIRLAAIEAHMKRQKYEPIGNESQLRAIIECAHHEVRELADRYVELINATRARALENGQ